MVTFLCTLRNKFIFILSSGSFPRCREKKRTDAIRLSHTQVSFRFESFVEFSHQSNVVGRETQGYYARIFAPVHAEPSSKQEGEVFFLAFHLFLPLFFTYGGWCVELPSIILVGLPPCLLCIRGALK